LDNNETSGRDFNYFPNIIQFRFQVEQLYNSCTGKKKAFLDLLLQVQEEAGDGSLSEQDIVYEVSTFMYAVSN